MVIRKKLVFDSPGVYLDTYTVNGITYQNKIVVQNKCQNDIYVKYLDRNCQYRFVLFNSHYRETIDFKTSSEVLNRIDYIDKDSLEKSIVGKDANRTITLYKTGISFDEYRVLRDIYVSPRIYVKLSEKWIPAKLKDGNAIVRKSKGSVYNIEITLLLDFRTITLL